jgi:hypothetical protein
VTSTIEINNFVESLLKLPLKGLNLVLDLRMLCLVTGGIGCSVAKLSNFVDGIGCRCILIKMFHSFIELTT